MSLKQIEIDSILKRVLSTTYLRGLVFSICGDMNKYNKIKESLNMIFDNDTIKIIIQCFQGEYSYNIIINTSKKTIEENQELMSLREFWISNNFTIDINYYLKFIDQQLFNKHLPLLLSSQGKPNKEVNSYPLPMQFYNGLIIKYWHIQRRYSDFGNENRGYIILGDSRYFDVWQRSPLVCIFDPSGTRQIGRMNYGSTNYDRIYQDGIVFCSPQRYEIDEEIIYTSIFQHFFLNKQYLCINYDDCEQKIFHFFSEDNYNKEPSFDLFSIHPCEELISKSFILTQKYNGIKF